ncbi:MAG: LysM peptidoglycan-binding domain-containing protein [Deltaproteobacteria bacterium]|nr:MAG: LysM peptidoglycan-binding domain-containing protein [Deltaproteobacteria bacterium]
MLARSRPNPNSALTDTGTMKNLSNTSPGREGCLRTREKGPPGWLAIAMLLCTMALASTASAQQTRYTVAPGDTLGSIAAEHGVRIADLRRWNRLSGDSIRVDQVLVIRGGSGGSARERRTYVVRSGDTGLAIASRLRVRFADLQRWNPRANLDRIHVGQRLTYYVAAQPPAGRRGTPNRGRLVDGVQLESGNGFRIRDPARSWGTAFSIAHIEAAYGRTSLRFPDLAPVQVADISFQRGGRIGGHASHQNGLDADITYFVRGEEEFNGWRRIRPDELDVERQWTLLQSWLLNDAVEYVFIDFALQQPLYEHAQARGASAEELEEWFQYPNRGRRSGVIRHEPGHADHLHVRFREAPSPGY